MDQKTFTPYDVTKAAPEVSEIIYKPEALTVNVGNMEIRCPGPSTKGTEIYVDGKRVDGVISLSLDELTVGGVLVVNLKVFAHKFKVGE